MPPLVVLALALFGLALRTAEHPEPWARDLTRPLLVAAVVTAAVAAALVVLDAMAPLTLAVLVR